MRNLIEFSQTADIRRVAALTVADVPLNTEISESARELMNSMRQEASEYGFSDAEIIRAVLAPVFKRTKGCNCYTCKARRIEDRQNEIASYQKTGARVS